jgi:anti-sigma B factor antagonist
MAELAYASVSKTDDRKVMWVRFPLSAPFCFALRYANNGRATQEFQRSRMFLRSCTMIFILNSEAEQQTLAKSEKLIASFKRRYHMKKKVLGLIGALEIELEGTDDIALLKLSGQIDSYTAEEITKIIDSHINNGNFKVIVDLTNIDYLDSAGLSAMINAKTKLGKHAGDLRIVGLKGKAKDVFDLAGLTDLFNLFDSREKAFDNF